MSPKLEAILASLDSACASEAAAVAECLRTIASNGGEQSEDAFLLVCAEEIKGWATEVINRYAYGTDETEEDE